MRKTITTVAAAAALTVSGVALANGGGPFGDVLGIGDERQQQFAEDLASQLDGVSPGAVSDALSAVREQNIEERRAKLAAALAGELDGVSAERVADALAKQDKAMRDAFESGQRPDPGSFSEGFANELGVSEDELRGAFRAAHEAMAEERQAELEERLDQAVADGEISEERADEIREHLDDGPRFGSGGPGGPRFGHGGPGGPRFGPGGPRGGSSFPAPGGPGPLPF